MKLLNIFCFLILFQIPNQANNLEHYIMQGDSAYKKFELESALIYYRKAFEINPENYNSLERMTKICNDLAEFYYELKEEDKAEKIVYEGVDHAKEFRKLFPDSAKVYTYLAWSFGNQALFEGGKEKIKLAHKIRDNATKAIAMDTTDYLPYIILSIYNRQIASLSWFERLFANTFFGDVPEGSFEDAKKYMLKALQIQPNIIIAYFHLSLIYREMDEEEKEVVALKKILDLPVYDFRDEFAKLKAEKRLEELLN